MLLPLVAQPLARTSSTATAHSARVITRSHRSTRANAKSKAARRFSRGESPAGSTRGLYYRVSANIPK
jgi:hypothetical protein